MDTSETLRETARDTEAEATAHEPELAVHPGPIAYVKVAVVLALATAIEVGLYYVTDDMPAPLYIGLLMFFMTFKFAMVVLWFMHLRFDSPMFTRTFVAGLVLAVAVYCAALATFEFWSSS